MKEKNPMNVEIGQRIKEAREGAGLTQDKFSELLGLGEKHISAIERGAVGVSVPALRRICTLLSISADTILFEKPDDSDQDAREEALRLLLGRLSRLPDDQFWNVKELIDKLLFVIAMDH